jgi:hydrogenase-4 membrane subunit HyfE
MDDTISQSRAGEGEHSPTMRLQVRRWLLALFLHVHNLLYYRHVAHPVGAKEREMHQIPRLWKGRYGAALLMVGSGTLGVRALMALIDLPIFVLYSVSIAKTTCTGGLGDGLVAVALLVSNDLFLPPYFNMTSDHSVLPLVVGYLGTIVLSSLRDSRGRSSPRHE